MLAAVAGVVVVAVDGVVDSKAFHFISESTDRRLILSFEIGILIFRFCMDMECHLLPRGFFHFGR